MATRDLDGREMRDPAAFYEAFFAETTGLLPDYGGRNLDALNDVLRELTEPLTLVLRHSEAARTQLGGWLDRCLAVFQDRAPGEMPVRIILD